MAQRRMFSPQIIDSDAFLDMSSTAQALYFHLGMRADDDGFVGNPKKILRMIGGNDDDLKILLAKRFILTFESGVIVIKHWRINNLIRKDWHRDTIYSEELNRLTIKENGAYTELVNDSLTIRPRSIVKDSIVKLSKDNITETSSVDKPKIKERTNIQLLVDYFFELKGWNKDGQKTAGVIYSRYTRPAKDLLELCGDNIDLAKRRLEIIKNWADSQELEWSIETVFKRWHDLDQLPQEREKKAYIDGNHAYTRGDKWFVIMKNGEHKEYIGDKSKIEYK